MRRFDSDTNGDATITYIDQQKIPSFFKKLHSLSPSPKINAWYQYPIILALYVFEAVFSK